MPSETDFLNNALGSAGCSRITGLDDSSVEAGWCRTYYPSLRRATQRMANWKFTGARLSLNHEIAVPAFGYAYSFPLPASILKLRTYNGIHVNLTLTDDPTLWHWDYQVWRIEGTKLFANNTPALIEYVQDVTNPDVWDALYYEMLAAWLGSKLAMAIRKDGKKAGELLEAAMGVWMPLALSVDGQQASPQVYQSQDLIWGRNF